MFNDDELKDMADKMELPLKEGAWEFVEAQIPVYPTKKRYLLLWRRLLIVACVGALITLSYFTSKSFDIPENLSSVDDNSPIVLNKPNSKQTFDASAQSNSSKNNNPIDQMESIPNELSGKNNEEVKRLNYESVSILKPSESNNKSKFVKSKILNPSNNEKYNYTFGVAAFNSKTFKGDNATPILIDSEIGAISEMSRQMALKQMNRKYYSFNFNHQVISNKKVSKTPMKKWFVGFNYGILNTNIQIEPELMKLPKGKGNELSVYTGFEMKKWSFSVGLHSARFKQTTSMGNTHDTTYYQVFKPNFETVLPSEYAGRLHDTSSLYLAGTNHNKVNQEFSVFGLSLNVTRSLVTVKDFSLNLSYGINYKLLTKANTFFYDSINRAAVPFTQSDKGIVFKHLASSRVRIGINYNVSKRVGIEVSPFIDYFHKPFIKHYYKADLLNYGVSVGLNYRLN